MTKRTPSIRAPRSPRRALALVAAVGLLLSACADDGTDGESSADAGTIAGSDATTDADPGPSTSEAAGADTQPDPGDDTATTSEADASEGGSFSVSISEPSALDPALAQELEGAQVTRLLFQTLTSLNPDFELQPGAATEWSVADDGVTWTFALNPDAVFSDGSPVDADDFVYAFARTADPDLAAPASYQGYPISGWADVLEAEASGAVGDVPVAGVTAIDDHTLEIVTEAPFSLLPLLLTYPVFAPVPSEMRGDADAESAFAEQPIGNGPYAMSEPWQHNESITVVRNDSFAGPAGKTARIDFRIYSDLLTSYRDYQAGSLDIARGIPPEELQSASDEYGELVIRTPMAALGYIGYPMDRAPFDNADFRKALSLAVDREALAERVLQGGSDPAGGYVPPQVPGARTEPCDVCVYDEALAQEYFEKSGVEPGTSIVLYDISDDGQASIEFLVNAWTEQFGLEIEVRSFEFAQFLEETAAGVAEGPFELGWVWDYPSGYSILQPLFATVSGANNLSYSNPAFDELMTRIETSTEPDEVAALLAEAEELVLADMPMIPLTFGTDVAAVSGRTSGLVVDAGGLHRLELVEVAD